MTNVFHWPERRGHDHMEECERWADTLKPRYKETAHLQTAVMVYQPERRKSDMKHPYIAEGLTDQGRHPEREHRFIDGAHAATEMGHKDQAEAFEAEEVGSGILLATIAGLAFWVAVAVVLVAVFR